MVGSIVAKCREHRNAGLPNYVAGTDTHVGHAITAGVSVPFER